MKRIVFFCLSMLFVLMVAACGQQQPPAEVKETVVKRTDAANGIIAPEQHSVTYADSYQGDMVSATVTGITYEAQETTLNLRLKNDGDEPRRFVTANLSINGLMCHDFLFTEVAAHAELDGVVKISNQWFSDMGVTKIKDCEFVIKVYDTNNDEIMQSSVMKVYTDAPDSYVQEIDKSGVELYNQNGIILSVKSLRKATHSEDTELVFYMENNTDSSISLMSMDVCVNGIALEPEFVISVGAHKKAVDTMVFSAKDLTDNGIEKITTVSSSFKAFNENLETVLDLSNVEVPIAE